MSLGAGVCADRADVITVETSKVFKRLLRVGKIQWDMVN